MIQKYFNFFPLNFSNKISLDPYIFRKEYCQTVGKESSKKQLLMPMAGYRNQNRPRFSRKLANEFIAWLLISSEQPQIAVNATEQSKSKCSLLNYNLKQGNKSFWGLHSVKHLVPMKYWNDYQKQSNSLISLTLWKSTMVCSYFCAFEEQSLKTNAQWP